MCVYVHTCSWQAPYSLTCCDVFRPDHETLPNHAYLADCVMAKTAGPSWGPFFVRYKKRCHLPKTGSWQVIHRSCRIVRSRVLVPRFGNLPPDGAGRRSRAPGHLHADASRRVEEVRDGDDQADVLRSERRARALRRAGVSQWRQAFADCCARRSSTGSPGCASRCRACVPATARAGRFVDAARWTRSMRPSVRMPRTCASSAGSCAWLACCCAGGRLSVGRTCARRLTNRARRTCHRSPNNPQLWSLKTPHLDN